jgi:hypothetical protein
MILYQMEIESLRSDARAVAFILRAMDSRNQQRLDFDETNLRVIHRMEALRSLDACKPGGNAQQEFVDIAEPFRTSPEIRIKTLIEFAQWHRSKMDVTEATISQLTEAESVAEHFAMLNRLPDGVLADLRHPALSFN